MKQLGSMRRVTPWLPWASTSMSMPKRCVVPFVPLVCQSIREEDGPDDRELVESTRAVWVLSGGPPFAQIIEHDASSAKAALWSTRRSSTELFLYFDLERMLRFIDCGHNHTDPGAASTCRATSRCSDHCRPSARAAIRSRPAEREVRAASRSPRKVRAAVLQQCLNSAASELMRWGLTRCVYRETRSGVIEEDPVSGRLGSS